MTLKIKHALLLSLLVMSYASISSCSQDTDFASIKDLPEKNKSDQTISFTLSIKPDVLSVGQLPKVRLFKKYNPAVAYSVKTVVDSKKTNNFEISTDKLPAGQYRLYNDRLRGQGIAGAGCCRVGAAGACTGRPGRPAAGSGPEQ